MRELSQEQLEELREAANHPGWKLYLEIIEELMLENFQQMFSLDPGKAESFVKFVELKGRIDQLKEITYYYQRELAENPEGVTSVDSTYASRFKSLLSRLLKRG